MQKFGQPANTAPTDSMSDSGAQELLRLHLQRTEGQAQLSVVDVAEAIRLPEDEVRQLLSEIREHKQPSNVADQPKVAKRNKLRDGTYAIAGATLFILMALCIVAWGLSPVGFSVPRRHLNDESVVQLQPGEGVIITIADRPTTVRSLINPLNYGMSEDLLNVLSNDMELQIDTNYAPDTEYGQQEADTILKQMQDHSTENVSSLRYITIRIDTAGRELSAQTDVPISSASNKNVQDFLKSERRKMLKGLLKLISTKERLKEGRPDGEGESPKG